MKCPTCGQSELIHGKRDLPYTYKGCKTVIKAVEADWCDACGESLTGPGETDRVMKAMREFNASVNSAQMAPEFIVQVRNKLGLNQRQAAELFGGGVNAFSRYETGKTQPPLALVKLFKVLDRHPELIDEIRA